MQSKTRIRSFSDLEFISSRVKKVVTLFSGGVDSTYVLKKLSDDPACRIIAVTVDLGDGVDAQSIKAKAAAFGAESIIVDGREQFLKDAVIPALRANARYMSIFPISASLSRPLMAQYAVDVAKEYHCEAIIHTANQSQNSLRRLNGAIGSLGFSGYYGSPYEFTAMSRSEKLSELVAVGITDFHKRDVSADSNLWCREFESGDLDNPEKFNTCESLYEWSKLLENTTSNSTIRIGFDRGLPVSVDGAVMPLIDLIAHLNRYVGSFGIGRFAGLEHLEQGERVLEVREAPAAHILMEGFRHLETAILEPELVREKISLEQIWVREAVEGRWFGGLRQSINRFIEETSERITGSVEFRLRPGAFDLFSISANSPTYIKDRDGWEKQVAHVRGARSLNEMSIDPRR